MKCSLGISDFLEEISSLSHSIAFLYFFALIAEAVFLSPCYSLELCIQMVILSFSPLPLASPLFTAICKTSSDSHFAFLHFFFLGMFLISPSCTMSRTSVHSSSGQETPREFTGHSKHPLPTTKDRTLHMDIIRWSISKSD